MGHFIEPTELQRKTDNIMLQTMDQVVLDELYVWPAEKRIEQRTVRQRGGVSDPS